MSEIKKELIRGTIFTGMAKYSGLAVSILVTGILARYLQPNEFGIVAIATFFINFFSSLTISGIGPAIIQHRELDEFDIENIYTFTGYLGIALSLLFIALSSIIAEFYEDDFYLPNICKLLSIQIFFSIFVVVPNSILLKEKRFRFVSFRMLVVNMIGGLISVISVFIGLGIYSLIVNPIFSSIAIYIITINKRPVRFCYSVCWSCINKILSFSVYQMLFNFVYLIYRGVDKLIIGKCFELKALGYYEKSYRLMMLPLENITGVVQPVLHPILSEFQKDKLYVYSAYIKIIKFLSEIGFLMTAFLFFTAHELIMIIFGEQWTASIPIFQILSLSVGIQMAQSPVGIIFQTFNRVKDLFYCSLACLLIVILSILAGVYFADINLMAILLVLSFYLIFCIYNFFICRLIHAKFLIVLKTIAYSILKASLLFVILFFANKSLTIESSFMSLFLKTLLSVIYFGFTLYFGFYKDIPLPSFILKHLK